MRTATDSHTRARHRTPRLEGRMQKRLLALKWDVVLRDDFSDLGGYDQVGRQLHRLVEKGTLVKIGRGIYSKATIGPISGRPVPVKDIKVLAKQAMTRLGVEVGQTDWEKRYFSQQTDQVPLGNVIAVKSRVRRKIAWGSNFVAFKRTR